ncbi:MAG: DUF2244 domain-containing protein [Pseudomonadota bacterium]
MHRFVLTPNCALSAGGAVLFFAGIATVSLVIAFGFVLMGYWPVLPFAGLELALLGWALRRSWQRGQCSEEIVIDANEITLIERDADGETCRTRQLPTPWTQVALITDRRGVIERELAFGREGCWWVFGRFLVEPEKRSLRRRIEQVLRQIRDTAPLVSAECDKGPESPTGPDAEASE